MDQRGTWTRAGLQREGRGPGYGDRRTRAGLWVRAAPSTYLTGDADLRDRVCAALAHAGPDAVVTGWAGCAALGLPYVVDGGAVPVLVPSWRRRVTTAHVRVLPTTRHPAYWSWSGVRVAAPARCVVDAARALDRLRDVRALVLGAPPRVTLEELREELEAGARNGSALCRRALVDLERGAASAPEAEVADVAYACARRGGLPSFLLNPELLLDGEFVGCPDGWFVGLGLGWEVESKEFHGEDEAFESTMERSDRFVAHGLTLLHLTPRRLRALGVRTGDLLAAATSAAVARGAREPSGLVVRPRGPLLP